MQNHKKDALYNLRTKENPLTYHQPSHEWSYLTYHTFKEN